MDLSAVLKKTKQRAERVKVDRPPPSIATQDRPYEKPSPSPSSLLAVTNDKPVTLKPDTKWTQSAHKPDTNLCTNRTQSAHSTTTYPEPKEETGHKVDTQPDTRPDTKWTQSAHKPDTRSGFSALVGIQREIAVFIYRSCQSVRSQITEPLSLEHISTSLEIRIGSVKTTLRRLEEKGVLRRVDFKNGRGGWSKYELLEGVFGEMLRLETGHKLNTNRAQTEHKVYTKPDTQPDTSLSSSSSSVLKEDFKTTTTDETELFKNDPLNLSPEWQQVDISPLASVGFTQSHLIQIVRQGKLPPVEVQDSINFYAFDLTRNRLKPNSPLNFFMGIVRKGIPYAPPENYESPADEARRKTREFKERKVREQEETIKQLMELDFKEWRQALSLKEIQSMVPEYAERPGQIQESYLKKHHEEVLWPERSAKLDETRVQIQRQIEQSLVGEGRE